MTRMRRGTPVTTQEIYSVLSLAQSDPTIRGARDAAMIALVDALSLDAGRISALEVSDYRPGGLLRLPDGMEWRRLDSRVDAILQRWLQARGNGGGPLFQPIGSSACPCSRGLSRTSVAGAMMRRALQARLQPFSPADVLHARSILGATPESPAGVHSRRMLLRYLSRFEPERRARIQSTLDEFCQSIGHCAAADFPWVDLRAETLPAGEDLRKRWRGVSLSRIKSAINGILREGLTDGLISEGDVEAVRRLSWNSLRAQPPVTTTAIQDVAALFEGCLREATNAARRDGALFALIWERQLSVSEVIRVEGPLQVVMPNPECPIAGMADQVLRQWRDARGSDPGSFLLTVNRRDNIEASPMTRGAAEFAFRRRALNARAGHISPASLRRLSIERPFSASWRRPTPAPV